VRLAHGLGGRTDLPVPRWLFVYGAAAALVVSFVALGALWREPRLERRTRRSGGNGPLQALVRSRAAETVVRAASVGLLGVVTISALAGRNDFAPALVYVWLWVGLAFAHALLGNLWATLSPFDSLARFLLVGQEPRRTYPKALGRWPAVAGLATFVWLELVAPFGAEPRALGVAIALYTAISLGGARTFGRETWNANGEFLAVLFGLIARISPLERDAEGRVVARPVLSGLATLEPVPGQLAFVLVWIGSTTFDGSSRSSLWRDLTAGLSTVPRTLAGTAGLAAAVAAVSLAYALAMAVAGAVARQRWHTLAVRFAHSLVPIAFAYVVAHYFSLVTIEGQLAIALASDPFGLGWDLFGTGRNLVDVGIVSANQIWYVQVAAIVGGHVGGVVLAHDRAIARFPPRVALRTQYALLAVMVLFTVTGLLILSG
jgi:hypothetical protein